MLGELLCGMEKLNLIQPELVVESLGFLNMEQPVVGGVRTVYVVSDVWVMWCPSISELSVKVQGAIMPG